METSSTSKKHKKFVSAPMKEKHARELPGIGEVLGRRLEDAGYEKASKVYGQFLVMKKDEKMFQEWLQDTCKASSKQSGDCYKGLKDYTKEFLE